ncbi:hypothetical protein U9M48_041268 [Paspalum notatum var. saurae]|uniref:Uncharacterized protein n=1 Tax=Paspalum notatum var. saurae TaxID=547442 RepID=A0AAQ3XEN6_PASNO
MEAVAKDPALEREQPKTAPRWEGCGRQIRHQAQAAEATPPRDSPRGDLRKARRQGQPTTAAGGEHRRSDRPQPPDRRAPLPTSGHRPDPPSPKLQTKKNPPQGGGTPAGQSRRRHTEEEPHRHHPSTRTAAPPPQPDEARHSADPAKRGRIHAMGDEARKPEAGGGEGGPGKGKEGGSE